MESVGHEAAVDVVEGVRVDPGVFYVVDLEGEIGWDADVFR